MAMIGIQTLGAKHRGEIAALLTVVAQEETLGLKIVKAGRLLTAEAMRETSMGRWDNRVR